MEINPVNQLGTSMDVSDANFALNFQDYLQLLVTEITTQDPLNPVDNKEFITQLATYSQLNVMSTVSTALENLGKSVYRQEAVALLGKEVEVRGTSGDGIIGEVVSTRIESSSPLLTVKTSDGEFLSNIKLSELELIR